MPDERYEIRGKIGQGGVGAVYRAWDTRLNRDVAIKRVLADGGYESQDNAIEHLLKEATSLSSVQHPHIVTVFDAGVDEEGPFVVMELLTGRTIDEMIERGSLVFEDFREVAVQTQEALIAAQDLNLVHRDLKPTNVMVTWLPSGKFQVKLVDFGLAKFHPKPSVQTIDHGDAVFGSIHFMAPEQFERKPLDQRTDMYALGCLYYFCLTGLYPFNGETAPEVMTAHLQHQVTPLEELRPDLPDWVCQWVMWHIAREMEDRPPGAREALQNFLECESGYAEVEETSAAEPKFAFPENSEIRTPTPASPPTTAVVTNKATTKPGTGAVMTKSAPQPLTPPEGNKPSVHTTGQVTASTTPSANPPSEKEAPQEKTEPPPAPKVKLATASAGSKINLKNPGAKPLAAAKPAKKAANKVAAPTESQTPATEAPPTKKTLPTQAKPGLGKGAKVAITVLLCLLIVVAGALLFTKLQTNNRNKYISELISQLENTNVTDALLTKEDTDLLLARVATLGVDDERQAIYQLLSVAKSSDGSDLDDRIAKFSTTSEFALSKDLRTNLFKVVRLRKGPTSFPHLIKFAKGTSDPELAKLALAASEGLATEEDVHELLNIITFSNDLEVKQAAESSIASVARRSDYPQGLSRDFIEAYEQADETDDRHIHLRLLGTVGGDEAKDAATKELGSSSKIDQLASIAAIKNWPDDGMFTTLMDFLSTETDRLVREQAFNAAHATLLKDSERTPEVAQEMWTALKNQANTRKEKLLIISGLARRPEDWAFQGVESYLEDSDDQIVLQATRALDHLNEKKKKTEN